jgi:cytochrome c oxidase subunit 4
VAHSPSTTSPSKPGSPAEHEHGTGRYFAIWLILLACTGLTVFTGHKDLGGLNLPLALAIATLKAVLVVLFFMHMTEAAAANKIVFVVSIVFALVLIVGVFGDLLTRNPMSLPSAAPSTEGPEIEVPGEASSLVPTAPEH